MFRNFFVLISTLLLLLVSSPSFSASMIYNEDFEDNNSSDTFGTSYSSYWDEHLACTQVVTNNPHSGNYSFRGSLSENGTVDNITGEAGCGNARNSFGQGPTNFGNTNNFDVSTINTGEFYLSWWVKFDEGELANLRSDTHKMLYLYTNGSANYLILHINEEGGMEFFVNADNAAGYPYTAGDRAPNYQYGYNVGSYPDDGNWHHFELYADWGTGGGADTTLRLWVDRQKRLDVDDAVAIYRTGDRPWTVTLPSNKSAASTTITTVGWQVDDIEIWDGLPPSLTITPPHVHTPVVSE